MAAGDVVLVRIESETVAVGRQPGAHVADGAPRFGLADADAEQTFAARRDRQPAVFHRVVAEVLDRARWSVEDELSEDRARHVGAGELLQHDRGLDVAESRTAPTFADRDAEQVGFAHAVPRPLRELFGLVAMACHRRQLALGDVARELPQRGLVFGVGKRIRAGRVRSHPARLPPELTFNSGRSDPAPTEPRGKKPADVETISRIGARRNGVTGRHRREHRHQESGDHRRVGVVAQEGGYRAVRRAGRPSSRPG